MMVLNHEFYFLENQILNLLMSNYEKNFLKQDLFYIYFYVFCFNVL